MPYNDKTLFKYVFSSGETNTMTPIDAHRYCIKKNMRIISGPGYVEGKRKESFKGWGYHDSLQRVFKGPHDYKTYLRANGLIECGDLSAPQYTEPRRPYWNDETIKMAVDNGIEVGSVLAEALKSGKLDFPDGTILDHET